MSSEIKVDTISENTSANGVAIDSLGIKDGKITNLMNSTLNAADMGAVHIKVASSGDTAIDSNNDDLVIENDNHAGITISTPNDKAGGLYFSDPDDTASGRIVHDHSANTMIFQAGNLEFLRTDSSRKLSTGGEDTPDCDAGGLTLDENANDGAILTLKSSDVAHGMTALEETDTWLSVHKDNATAGGIRARICSGQVKSLKFECFATGENTAEATSALSNFAVDGRPKSGTSVSSHDSDANLASFRTGDSAQLIIKGDGELFSNASATVGTFDEYEDAQLIRSYDLTRGEGNKVKGLIASKFDKFIKYNRDDLKDARLIGKDEDGNATNFMNLNGFIRLHNGAIWQQYEKHQKLANAMYELAKAAVGEEKADEILEQNDIKLLN